MAPVPPRTSIRTGKQVASFAKTTPQLPLPDDFGFADEFRTNKKDKRTIKHETFLARIEKSRKKKLKRRRPSKKLVTNLDSLADALPGSDDDEDTDMDGSPRAKKAQGLDAGGAGQSNIIKQKSLKHKPGALKKKEKIDARERDRFQRNLAQMSSALKASREASGTAASTTGTQASAPAQAQAQAQPTTQTQDGAVSNRWAALRNFISQTMEQNPAFSGQQNNAA
ncbi:hypothetical protein KEM55_002744 [Ascosphaera atra]|nr:hypothetical protein KEM55_002744 [Ascosphaera atra]